MVVINQGSFIVCVMNDHLSKSRKSSKDIRDRQERIRSLIRKDRYYYGIESFLLKNHNKCY